jgi:hypothetical protein
MDDSKDFWKHAEKSGISVEEIDMVFLMQQCGDLVRIFEHFLRCNHKAKIYLPRENNEEYLRSVYNKLMSYAGFEQVRQWSQRTVFMDATEQRWRISQF